MARGRFLRLGFLLILLVWCTGIVAAQTAGNDGKNADAKITVLVVYSPGPSWLKGKSVKDQPLKEHGKYMLELYGKGIMKYAGPFTDGSGGAAVLEVKSLEEAVALIKDDPAVKSGVMTPKVLQWELAPWEKYLKK